MYKTIDEIKRIRNKSIQELGKVYSVVDLDTVYKKQTALNSMAIGLNAELAEAIMPALEDDGLNRVEWFRISARLGTLNFKGIPDATEIRNTYGQAVSQAQNRYTRDQYTVSPKDNFRSTPKVGERINIKSTSLPRFLVTLIAQGIAIPLVLLINGKYFPILGKVLFCVADVTAMAIEVVMYLNKTKSSKSSYVQKDIYRTTAASNAETIDWNAIYAKVIREVERDNKVELNRWFDSLEQITLEEINRAKASGGN